MHLALHRQPVWDGPRLGLLVPGRVREHGEGLRGHARHDELVLLGDLQGHDSIGKYHGA